jgi:hypothetical protein
MANRRSNGGNGSPESVSSLVEIIQAPAANSFLVSQRFALEAAKFWARRMRAYADQMEDLANCRSTEDIAGAQARFIERMREDYATESEALGNLLKPENLQAPRGRNGEVEAEG